MKVCSLLTYPPRCRYAGLSAAGFQTAASMVQQGGSSAPCSFAQQQAPCQALSTEQAVEEHLSPPAAEPLSPSSVLDSPRQLPAVSPSPEAAQAPEEQRCRQPLTPAQSALPHRLSMLKRRSLDWLLHKLPGWLMLRGSPQPAAAACGCGLCSTRRSGVLDMGRLHLTLAHGSLASGVLLMICWPVQHKSSCG